jgi:hypothetical protein
VDGHHHKATVIAQLEVAEGLVAAMPPDPDPIGR